MKAQRRLCCLGLLLAALVDARDASSLTIEPDPVDLTIGQLDLVGVVNGLPAGGVIQFGSVASTDPTLLFQASFTADASDLTFTGPVYSTTSFGGGGTIPGGNFDVTLESPFAGVVRILEGIPAGQTTDVFFVSLSAFRVGDGVSVRVDSPGVLVGSGFTLVPEPATALLLGAGLCSLKRRPRASPSA